MGGNESETSTGWSWKENKVFEVALADVDQGDPNRWEAVASMVGGRSAEEVERHYAALLEDLESIESGKFDHNFGEVPESFDSTRWTEDDNQQRLTQLKI